MLEIQRNVVVDELDDFKPPSYEMPSVYHEQILDPKSMISKNIDDMLLYSHQKSTSLPNQSDQNISDKKRTEHTKESNIFTMDGLVEKVDEEFYENLNLDSKGLYGSEKVQILQRKYETVCLSKDKSIASSSQPEPQNKKATTSLVSEVSWSKRWGRDKDILAFTILREL